MDGAYLLTIAGVGENIAADQVGREFIELVGDDRAHLVEGYGIGPLARDDREALTMVMISAVRIGCPFRG
ncbi:hypothetical protein [Sphingomonas sp. CFBP 13720]|uniref:hypothetical protein n=1 Tax=Sphingomonas sp. CFBP 13720 TaxID=2775302 RepID=UPI0017820FB2|nr:hypothetical protein [Sphingomonas sp. CFBP 13720]MBD8676889.1 hypothetical protein [Sphingomonas sp. CFBP 13720]